MPIIYWRTVACATVLGVCGLAVWADDSLRGSKKTDSAPAKDPPRLVVDVSPSDPPVVPQAIDLQIEKASAAKIEPITPAPPSLPDDPPPLPAGKFNLPPMPTETPQPKPELPKPLELPASKRPTIVEPPPPIDKPAATKPPVAPAPEFAPQPTQATTTLPSTQSVVVPFKTCLHAGGTDQPHFEIKDGDVLLLKVSCECLELHSQQGVMAKGQVRLHGSGLDGTCDQLIISWPKKLVELNGNVNLNCQREGNLLQIAAEQMKLRLSGTGEPTIKASGVSTIAPAAPKH